MLIANEKPPRPGFPKIENCQTNRNSLKLLIVFLILATASLTPAQTAAPAKPIEVYPDSQKLLFWSPQEKPVGFRNMEKIFPGHTVKRGSHVYPLPYEARELAVHYDFKGEPWDTARYMEANNVAGLLILHDGKILLERYALGFDDKSRWTSFSVAKSFTSTMVGAAVADGSIKSIDDLVTDYLPTLKGTAYEGVKIRHILNMSSGVKWNEDYVDPKSDVNTFASATDKSRGSTLVTFMSKLPREVEPGTKFVYKTGETNLIGEIVMAATKKPLATYLSEKVWSKFGMERDAFWMLTDGNEMGGCCLSVSLRDYARFALFILNGGVIGGHPVVAPDWIQQATTPTEFSKTERGGYGYQWWTGPGGIYYAQGIFGQQIVFYPAEKLIVVSLSAWPMATNRDRSAVREAYTQAVRGLAGATKRVSP
jgi:CubicO group peptidase (beta-lactamase class C family)